MANSQMTAVTESVIKVRGYLLANLGIEQLELTEVLKISQESLYKVVLGLKKGPQVCQDGEYNLYQNGQKLNVAFIHKHIGFIDGKKGAPIPERLIYYKAIHHGGISKAELLNKYTNLLEKSDGRSRIYVTIQVKRLSKLRKMAPYLFSMNMRSN